MFRTTSLTYACTPQQRQVIGGAIDETSIDSGAPMGNCENGVMGVSCSSTTTGSSHLAGALLSVRLMFNYRHVMQYDKMNRV